MYCDIDIFKSVCIISEGCFVTPELLGIESSFIVWVLWLGSGSGVMMIRRDQTKVLKKYRNLLVVVVVGISKGDGR